MRVGDKVASFADSVQASWPFTTHQRPTSARAGVVRVSPRASSKPCLGVPKPVVPDRCASPVGPTGITQGLA